MLLLLLLLLLLLFHLFNLFTRIKTNIHSRLGSSDPGSQHHVLRRALTDTFQADDPCISKQSDIFSRYPCIPVGRDSFSTRKAPGALYPAVVLPSLGVQNILRSLKIRRPSGEAEVCLAEQRSGASEHDKNNTKKNGYY